MKKLAFVAAALAVLALGFLGCESGPRGLFRVGSEVVLAEDWQAFRVGRPTEEAPQESLDYFVRRERIVLASGSLNRDPEIQRLVADLDRALLEECLLDARLARLSPPTEEELKAFYQRKETRRRVRHLLTRDESSARYCLELLKRGNSFESVARKNSTDKKSAEQGGEIGWVSQDQLVLPFAQEAFSLPAGKLSEPVQTEYGFHILEVLEIKPADLKKFDENRKEVEMALLAQRRALQDHLLKQEAKARVPLTSRNQIPEEGVTASPGTVLLEVGKDEKITLGDLDAFLQSTFGRDPQGHGMGGSVKADMLKKMGERLQMAALASLEGIPAEPDCQARLREGRRKLLFAEASKRLVAEKNPDDAELEAFFASRIPALSTNQEVELSILVMGDIQRLDALAKLVRAGKADFETLVRKESADRETAEQGGDIGWLGKELMLQLLDEQSAELVLAGQPGAIVGPFRTPMGTVLFQVNAAREGTPFVLSEVREKVLQVYRAEKGAEMVDRFAGSLESQYPLRIEDRSALGLGEGGR